MRSHALALIAIATMTGCSNETGLHGEVESSPFRPVETCLTNTAGLDIPDTAILPAPTEPMHGVVEPIVCVLDPDRWGFSESGGVVTTTKELARINVPLLVEPGEELAGVEVWWLGAGGHAAIPSGMPTVSIWKTDMINPGPDGIGHATDDVQDLGVYQSVHSISAFITPEVVDVERYGYHAVIYSEYGDDAIPGAVFMGLRRLVLDGTTAN